ncbi:condensation domain-containing protein [Micromonospora sp. WMMA1923]|uniref:condensation domain-containing protein n=1 Tax=Micromonospora sp. WMMA1923 TaxID=3404125 RepID=UPI003B92B655
MQPMIFPTSYAQQGLLTFERLHPGTATYHVAFALWLHGPLDTAALTAAVSAVVERHESLRTTFTVLDGEAVQLVDAGAGPVVTEHDLSADPAAGTVEAVRRRLTAAVAEPFDLTRSAVRLDLYRRTAEEHVLAVTLHHAVADTWSCAVFVRDLSTAYTAARDGRSPELPEPPVQYVDYAVWQHDRLAGPEVAELETYWRETLAGAAPTLELTGDRDRPAVPSFAGATLPVALPPELVAAVTATSRRLRSTPFVVMLAAFQAVVARSTGRTDVLVTTSVATRTPEVEDLIGCFLNVLPIRVSVAGEPSFTELADRTRTAVLGAFEHQDLPFDRIVEQGPRPRDLRHQPLSQLMFGVQNAPMPQPELAGLTAEAGLVARGVAQFDLDIQLWAAGERIEGFCEYATDLFDSATVQRLWDRFVALLQDATTDGDRPLSQLAPLDPTDLRRALTAGGPTPAPAAPADSPAADGFPDLAGSPDAGDSADPAVAALSPAALRRWVGVLAEHAALRPDDRVLDLSDPDSPASAAWSWHVRAAGATSVVPPAGAGSVVLSAGAGSVEPSVERVADAAQWARLALAEQVTVLAGPAAELARLAALPETGPLPALRRLVVDGPLSEAVAGWFAARAPGLATVALLGGVEAGGPTLVLGPWRGSRIAARLLPGGRAAIVDPDGRLVAPGTPGELLLAAGPDAFAGRPGGPDDLVDHPYAGVDPATPSGTRLWRSGLAARQAVDDSIELLGTGRSDPTGTERVTPDRHIEPRDPVETVLAEIWGSVLQVGPVGVHDDFFALGGHSVAAMRIAALTGDTLAVELPVRTLFELPTVAAQAEFLVEAGRAAAVDVTAAAELALSVGRLSEEEVRAMLADGPSGA